MSRQTKEIIKTVAVLFLVAVVVYVYVVYPMGLAREAFGRSDADQYDPDSTYANDPTPFLEAGLAPDTFSVEIDGWTTMACLYLAPNPDSVPGINGTVFLLHEDGADRDAMIPLAQLFTDSGYAVVTCDLRASGHTTGKYRTDGQMEAGDIREVIRYLDLRDRISHPLIVIGGRLGADAALYAARQEPRIDAVVAMNPYLTTDRMLDILKEQYDMSWFPLFKMMVWWWYGIRSSYVVDFRTIDELRPVGSPTLLIMPTDAIEDPEVTKLNELSGADTLTVLPAPSDDEELHRMLFEFLAEIPPPSE